jgi:hypothetical protein
VSNYVTEEALDRLVRKGWTVKRREVRADEGRVLVLLHHAEDHVETFRSIKIDVEPTLLEQCRAAYQAQTKGKR